MPPVPFPTFADQIAEVVVKWENDSPLLSAVNVLHFQRTVGLGDLTALDLIDLGEHVSDWITGSGGFTSPGYASLVVTEYFVPEVDVTSEQTGAPFGVSVTVGATGLATGDVLPREVSLVASFRTGLLGRRNRGRCYVPGIPESANDDGRPAGAYVAEVQTVFADLIDNMEGEGALGWRLVIASHTFGTFVPVTSAVVDAEWDTMRKRSA